nr:serine/threonine-protein phosphatase 5-like isoform X2 [Ipomoea batatas]
MRFTGLTVPWRTLNWRSTVVLYRMLLKLLRLTLNIQRGTIDEVLHIWRWGSLKMHSKIFSRSRDYVQMILMLRRN